MHMNNYSHNDIKTENMILDESNHIKMIDFGLVSRLD